MADLAPGYALALEPATTENLAQMKRVYENLIQLEQVPIATAHLLHGGMYVRTIRLDAGIVMLGSRIKRPTVLIVHGATVVISGDAQIELAGYNVLPGSVGRQNLFLTQSQLDMTMIFATNARTVGEAENEVFADADLLSSRSDSSRDSITVTCE